MEYKTFEPDPDLQPFIRCYWMLRIPKDFAQERQQILPDGCIEMIFNLGDDIKRYTTKDNYIIQPRSFVLGQIIDPFFIEPTGFVDSFAVRFLPSGLSHFVSHSMSDLANKETELIHLFDQHSIESLEFKIKQAKESIERIQLVENFLFEALKNNIKIDDLIKSTIDTIFETNGRVGVNDMLHKKQEKRRQLERKFSKKVGTSPKQLCRIIRLQASLRSLLSNQKKSLTRVGYENEYFDQSHFIKDFKDFTGVSPKDFYKDQTFSLSSLFYKKE